MASLMVLVGALSSASSAFAEPCIVDSADMDSEASGTLRYNLGVKLAKPAAPNATLPEHCGPPTSDAPHYDAAVWFATPELEPHPGTIRTLLLTAPVSLEELGVSRLVIGNPWTATDDQSGAAASAGAPDWGLVILDASGLAADTVPFACPQGEGHTVTLRNVILVTHSELSEMPCLHEGDHVRLCSTRVVPQSDPAAANDNSAWSERGFVCLRDTSLPRSGRKHVPVLSKTTNPGH